MVVGVGRVFAESMPICETDQPTTHGQDQHMHPSRPIPEREHRQQNDEAAGQEIVDPPCRFVLWMVEDERTHQQTNSQQDFDNSAPHDFDFLRDS